jgi:histidine triad (HIT) family protein
VDCIFCKIAAGEIPAKIVFRDGDVVAIEDIDPKAPAHVLVLPVAHHANIGALIESGDATLLARLFETASRLGDERGPDGYRLVLNTGEKGGQTVDHLHIHLLAGRPMTWPPG